MSPIKDIQFISENLTVLPTPLPKNPFFIQAPKEKKVVESSSPFFDLNQTKGPSFATLAGNMLKKSTESPFSIPAIKEIASFTKLKNELSGNMNNSHFLELVDKMKEITKDLLIKQANIEFEQLERKVIENNVRLGQIRMINYANDTWMRGKSFFQLNEKKEKLKASKNELNLLKKQLKSTKKGKTSLEVSGGSGANEPVAPVNEELDANQQKKLLLFKENLIQVNLQSIKKEESELNQKEEGLNSEIILHTRELKLFLDQKQSNFNAHPVFSGRYLLLNLLGKGGFSEVYECFDLELFERCACKIHKIQSSWKAEQVEQYLKHTKREEEIQKKLNHINIVRLFDSVPLPDSNNSSFCSILEYCNEGDLDLRLKTHRKLPEKEVILIIHQVLSALKYLHSQNVIHYDLKPANILFQNGTVKITDFGLSKNVENSQLNGLTEITSQGAGTYSYLPPECFGPNGSKITNRVDIWSVGIICYQMLYGKKPFEQMEFELPDASKLEFLAIKPAVSQEAKVIFIANFLI